MPTGSSCGAQAPIHARPADVRRLGVFFGGEGAHRPQSSRCAAASITFACDFISQASSRRECAISHKSVNTRHLAHSTRSSSSSMSHLPDAPRTQIRDSSRAASWVATRRGAHQKGELSLYSTAISFVLTRPVTQPVIPLNFSEEAALEEQQIERLQSEFPLMGRLEGPSIVPTELLRLATTYRQACRLAWMLRRLRKLTFRQLAAECGLIHQHVGDYFNADDLPSRRDLPGDAVQRVESFLGNTAISQWHARNAGFSVLEEMQAGRRAA